MSQMFSKSVMDYVCGLLILILTRLIYGPPSFLFKLINFGTFCLFGYDKYQGLNRGYRIAENTLFLFSLLGGWCGSVCAMIIFRHKTYKNNFIGAMTIISIVNIVAVAKMRGLV